LQRRVQRLSPEALAQAVIAIQADVEWRRVRAIAAALRVDAVQQHSKFLDITVQSETEMYVSAASEPLNTAIEALAGCTTDEVADRKNCSIAAYDLDATSFVTADMEFDQVKNISCAHFHLPASNGTAELITTNSTPSGIR
jgi:hypothetical protein